MYLQWLLLGVLTSSAFAVSFQYTPPNNEGWTNGASGQRPKVTLTDCQYKKWLIILGSILKRLPTPAPTLCSDDGVQKVGEKRLSQYQKRLNIPSTDTSDDYDSSVNRWQL